MCVRETEAIIGKAPRLEIHTPRTNMASLVRTALTEIYLTNVSGVYFETLSHLWHSIYGGIMSYWVVLRARQLLHVSRTLFVLIMTGTTLFFFRLLGLFFAVFRFKICFVQLLLFLW